jgi:hypothetical protein
MCDFKGICFGATEQAEINIVDESATNLSEGNLDISIMNPSFAKSL